MPRRKTLKKEAAEAKKEVFDVFKNIYRNYIRAAYVKCKHAIGYLFCLPHKATDTLNKLGKRLLKSK